MNNKINNKIISILLIIITIVYIIPCNVSATNIDNTVAPCWDNTGVVSCKIGFPNDGYGYAEGFVMGHDTASRITADVYVYRQVGSSWVYVGEKHESIDDCTLGISCKFIPVSGAYYKAEFTFVVTKDGVDEVITDTVYKTA